MSMFSQAPLRVAAPPWFPVKERNEERRRGKAQSARFLSVPLMKLIRPFAGSSHSLRHMPGVSARTDNASPHALWSARLSAEAPSQRLTERQPAPSHIPHLRREIVRRCVSPSLLSEIRRPKRVGPHINEEEEFSSRLAPPTVIVGAWP